MKFNFKSAMFASLLAVALSFTACQNDYDDIVSINEETTMTTNSEAAILMSQVVSNDGSFDDIVDDTPCFNIQFPYSVKVNGLEVGIDSHEDIKSIHALLDSVDSTTSLEGLMEIIFPITIVMADYTEFSIESVTDLKEHANACASAGGYDDAIECVDLIYPVTYFTLNRNMVQTGSVQVNNDKEMRLFYASLDSTDVVSLKFPVTFEMHDNTKVTVNAIEEMRDLLQRSKEACDDEDNVTYSDFIIKKRFDQLLAKCPYTVQEVMRNNDQTEQYVDYIMAFSNDSTVTVKDWQGNMLNGEWATRVTENKALLKLEFDDLVDFNLEWFVHELDAETIKFYTHDGDKIVLHSTCAEDPIVCTEVFIAETLASCKWVMANTEGTSLAHLNIDFSDRNIHVSNPNGQIEDEGNWSLAGNALTFNDLSMALANYIGEWTVIECGTDRFKLKRGEEYLIIEKVCL